MSLSYLAFTAPLSVPLSRSFPLLHLSPQRSFKPLTPLHPRPLHSTPLIHPIRQTPKSHNCQTHALPNTPPHPNTATPPVSRLLSTLSTIRHSLPLALASTLLLSTAALLHLARLLPLISRFSLSLTCILAGLPILVSCMHSVFATPAQAIDVELLMTLAGLALIFSGALFEAALLAVLYSTSHAAEHAVQARASAALDELRDAAPEKAWRLQKGTAVEVKVSDVKVGDCLLVRAGEVVPCDGVIVEGGAFLSTQVLTGESRPVTVKIGDSVAAGSRAEDAPLVVRVTAVGAESSLARIARLVTAAKENRPGVTRFFDRFGQIYARGVLIVSALVALLMPMVFRGFGGTMRYMGRGGSFLRGLGVLVAASPCALLIGAPVAYLAALSCCARKGILAKSGAKSLEAASRAKHIVFDKTGTLTTGNLKLTSAVAVPNSTNGGGGMYASTSGNGVPHLDGLEELDHIELARVVAAAAALERGAVHPVATAFRQRADQLGGALPKVSDAKVIAGQGVEGVLNIDHDDRDMEITSGRLGRPSYILDGSEFVAVSKATEEASLRGETVSVLEIGEERYLLRLRDEVRQESAEVVDRLKKEGLPISVLTGDAQGAAEYVSNALGGGVKVISNATPQQKLDYVTGLGKELAKINSGVVMIGDGVNDAAALAASLVGVACGLSSATAVHAADVVLVHEDLHNLVWFLKKARQTKSIVLQNLVIALGLMLIATTACVAGAVPLWLAVTMHEGGTILVGLNALRLLKE